MGSVADFLRHRYERLGPRRHRWAPLVVGEAGLLLIAVVLGLVLIGDTSPHPERVSTEVRSCDLGTRGAAQITFTLNNDDRDSHNYQVHLVVTGVGSRQLGSGTTLVNHVGAGATVTSRLLVPVQGDPAGATCLINAEIFTGSTGHH